MLFNYHTAITTLRANKSRSFLSMLGIIIGIAAVILVISVGAGAQSMILNQVKGFGTNLIGVLPGASDEKGPPASAMGIVITTLKLNDAYALMDKKTAPHIAAVSGYVRGSAQMVWGDNSEQSFFTGVSATYPDVEDAKVSSGKFFSAEEEKSDTKVVVLGSKTYQNIFGDSDPLGKFLKIKKENFRVIGIMEERGTQAFQNQDEQVFVPVTTAQKYLLGVNHLGFIRAKVDNEANIDEAVEEIKVVLRQRHNIDNPDEDDFSVRSQKQGLEILTTITDALRYFLVAMAAIALLVGGIGIMNIMLIAVTERYKEIGLRKAVGAKPHDILWQFLVESIIVTLIGGIIGMIFGVIFSMVIGAIMRGLGYSWDTVISFYSIAVALSVSTLIGLIFGVYPAAKASKLDSVEALRYE